MVCFHDIPFRVYIFLEDCFLKNDYQSSESYWDREKKPLDYIESYQRYLKWRTACLGRCSKAAKGELNSSAELRGHSMFLVKCLIYMVIQFPDYTIDTTLDSLVNEKKTKQNYEWIWTVDLMVMTAYSELTEFIPCGQTLLLDISLDPALNNILLQIS